jgi:signal transduction histidine kinase
VPDIGRLRGGVAHEFNNLPTVIIGNVYYILWKVADEAINRMASTLKRAAQRRAHLTHQLLMFARRGARAQLCR